MANPVLTVDVSTYSIYGRARLTWTNANKGANWYSWRVYRRDSGGPWSLLKEYFNDQSNYTYDDYACKSNVAQEWIVVRVYTVTGVPTEEAKTSPVANTPFDDYFWLIHPVNPNLNLKLWSVNQDSYTMETDSSTLEVIGRGRKIDRGTNWGVKGNLVFSLKDREGGQTARQQLNVLRQQVDAKTWFWLRNPYGDIWRVMIGDPQIQRLAGVGTREFSNITLSYTEIAWEGFGAAPADTELPTSASWDSMSGTWNEQVGTWDAQ